MGDRRDGREERRGGGGDREKRQGGGNRGEHRGGPHQGRHQNRDVMVPYELEVTVRIISQRLSPLPQPLIWCP